MAEKGGKGFSISKGGKSALKSPRTDDNSKKGRKVQFDSTGGNQNQSSKSAGKVDTPNGKGDWGKGGKGDKTANGGKGPATKGPPPLELKIEQALPENTKCLMDCEAAQILEGIQEQMVVLSEDPTIKIPISFDRGLQYAKNGNRYTNPQAVRQVLENLKKHGASEGEICLIGNTCPESIDEAFALVRSLKGKSNKLREPLKDALDELAKLKHSS